MQAFDPWAWRDPDVYDPTGGAPAGSARAGAGSAGANLVGYTVYANDGVIGSVNEASYQTGASYLTVDTGPWARGRRVLVPAGTVRRVDHHTRAVHLDCTKNQIMNSPAYDPQSLGRRAYRDRVGSYFEDRYPNVQP